MAQKDPENGPSLELPSLFGRRKRRTPETEAEASRGQVDTAERTQLVEPQPEPVAEPEPVGEPEPVAEPETEHTAPLPAVEQPTTAHTPAATPTAVPTPMPAPTAEPAPAPAARTRPWQRGATPTDAPNRAAKPTGGRRAARAGGRTLPEVAASTAVVVVGGLIGLVGCVLTFLGLKSCELVTGTDSCGGPGLLVLVVILVAMVLLGAVVLRALRVAEAGNISFLGVGIMTVVALIFFADYLYEPWMFLVVPLVTALSFGVARWITTRYADDVFEDDDDRPHYDVR